MLTRYRLPARPAWRLVPANAPAWWEFLAVFLVLLAIAEGAVVLWVEPRDWPIMQILLGMFVVPSAIILRIAFVESHLVGGPGWLACTSLLPGMWVVLDFDSITEMSSRKGRGAWFGVQPSQSSLVRALRSLRHLGWLAFSAGGAGVGPFWDAEPSLSISLEKWAVVPDTVISELRERAAAGQFEADDILLDRTDVIFWDPPSSGRLAPRLAVEVPDRPMFATPARKRRRK